MSKLAPLLACLMLSACAPKDPPDTLKFETGSPYTAAPAIVMERPAPGETPPFRLKAQTYRLLLLPPDDLSFEVADTCRVNVALLLPDGTERPIDPQARPGFEERRLTISAPGLYRLRVLPSEPSCQPIVVLSR